MLRKTIAIACLAAFGLVSQVAAQTPPPSPLPDPKMPPMPSMEAPDANDMTKPAGTGKSAGAPKPAATAKPATAAKTVESTKPLVRGGKGATVKKGGKATRMAPGAARGRTAVSKRSSARPTAAKRAPTARKSAAKGHKGKRR